MIPVLAIVLALQWLLVFGHPRALTGRGLRISAAGISAAYVLNRLLPLGLPVVPEGLRVLLNAFLAVELGLILPWFIVPPELLPRTRTIHAIWSKFCALGLLLLLGTPPGGAAWPILLQTGQSPTLTLALVLVGPLVVMAWLAAVRLGRSRLRYECVIAGVRNSLVAEGANALFEELAFRALLLSALVPLLGAGPAVLAQAILFGTAHLRGGAPVGPRGAALTAGLGLLLGGVVLATGSVLPAVALHGGAVPFLVPLAREGWHLVRSRGRGVRTAPVPLFRCRCRGEMFLCGGIASGVKIGIGELANAAIKRRARGMPDGAIAAELRGEWEQGEVEEVLRQVRVLEAKGAALLPRPDPVLVAPCVQDGSSPACLEGSSVSGRRSLAPERVA